MVIAKNGELRTKTGRTATFVVAASDSEHKDEADYICDGVADEVELQAALDAIAANGGGKLVQSEGTYTWTAAVTYSASNLEWEGVGHVINDCSVIAGTLGALKIEGAITGTNSALTAEGTKGQKDVTVADASSFSAGDWIRIRSETLFNSGDQHLGELQKIASIAGNVITCEDILASTYTVADTATVDLLTVYENITLRNMHFVGNYGEDQWKGIMFSQIHNVLIEDIHWTYSYCYPIKGYDVVGLEVRGCTVKDADQAGFGYGVVIMNASRDILIHHNKFYNCRHGVVCGGNATYGVQTNQVYDSNVFRYSIRTAGGIGPHNTYDGLVISNNTARNDGLTYVAGINNTIVGNTVYNDVSDHGAIRLTGTSKHTTITGNLIETLNQDGIQFRESGTCTDSDVVIANNEIRVLGGSFSSIKARHGHHTNVLIANNYMYSLDSYCVYFQNAGDCTNISVLNNIMESKNTGAIFFDAANILENLSISNNLSKSCATSPHLTIWGQGLGFEAKYIQINDNKISEGSIGIKMKHIKYFSIHDNDLINITTGIQFATNVDHYTIKNNHFVSCATPIDDQVKGTREVYTQHSDLFMDALAASANAVHAAITGTGAEQEITTAITNPDVPRNVSITNSANSTGDVKIDGVDAKGNSVTDTITIVTGGIAYGVVAFATVSKITIPATVANPDTITVGISDKLGISNIIYASGDVYKVKVNNADDPTIGTVNTTYHTVDCATINAADDITIWYKSNLNIIS